MSTKAKRIYVHLTEAELKELRIALGPHKQFVKSKHARLQNRYGYRDHSPSQLRVQATRSAIQKLSDAQWYFDRQK